MAVLSKIRQRSLLLIVVIGFCLLAFVIGDLIQGGGFQSTPKYVGTINGEDISFEDFRTKVDAAERGQQGMSNTQAVSTVWDQLVSVALLNEQFEKLGIQVGENQILEMLKQNPQIGQNPQFQNAAGQFDAEKFKAFFQADPQMAAQLLEMERQAELSAKSQIYSTLIKSGFYTTDAEAKLQHRLETEKVSFNYVAYAFSNIKDSEVPVSDDEIVAYMRKNEKRYKAEESRSLEYVLIEDKPSTEDENEVKKTLTDLMNQKVVFNEATGKNDTVAGFNSTANVVEFVNANSDIKYDSTYITKSKLPAQYADNLYNLQTGQTFGPYVYNGYYAVSKSMGKRAGASAKAAHILVAYAGGKAPNPAITRTKDEAQAKANDLLAQVQANPAAFGGLAAANSDDPGSAQNGGEYDNIVPGQMVPAFDSFVFNKPIGSLGVVETEFGYHVIKVIDKQDAIRLATVALRIEPSEKTSDDIFTKATKFEMEAAEKDFAATAKSMGLSVAPAINVKAFDDNFASFSNQRQVVRWAFDKETAAGDVKKFNVPGGNLIVKMKKVNEEGLLPVSDARPSIEPILKNQKKAEKIKAIMKGSTLEQVATASKMTVQTAADVTVAVPNLSGVGFEPKVVATAIATAPNKVSQLIEGRTGVFMVKTTAVTKAPAATDLSAQKQKLQGQGNVSMNKILPSLKDNADIEDNRLKFGY